MKDLSVSLNKLEKKGLNPEFRDGKIPLILGGKTISKNATIKTFQEAFSISYENNGWVVRLPGEGQLINEYNASSLIEAVELVINFYH